MVGSNRAVCLVAGELMLANCMVKTSKGVYHLVDYVGDEKAAAADAESNLIYQSMVFEK